MLGLSHRAVIGDIQRSKSTADRVPFGEIKRRVRTIKKDSDSKQIGGIGKSSTVVNLEVYQRGYRCLRRAQQNSTGGYGCLRRDGLLCVSGACVCLQHVWLKPVQACCCLFSPCTYNAVHTEWSFSTGGPLVQATGVFSKLLRNQP